MLNQSQVNGIQMLLQCSDNVEKLLDAMAIRWTYFTVPHSYLSSVTTVYDHISVPGLLIN